jgi:predicted ATP-grasp superfamily ATP-dependent carboligase
MVRPTGSGSSLRESIAPPADMVSAARKLLDALQWHGVAMVESKRDARDGTPKLMEINGRFWNSLPLADAAGVDFPLLLYRMATEGDVHEQFDYRVGVKCRWLVGDFQHLLQVFRGRPAGWTDSFPTRREALLSFLRFFERDLHYDNLWPSDPLPFVAEMGTLVLRRFPELLRRQRTHAIEQALPAASPDKALR